MHVSDSCLEQAQDNVFSAAVNKMMATVADVYCRTFHRSISRPVNGKYHCWRCLKQFEIQW
jgi:hypothetical protein